MNDVNVVYLLLSIFFFIYGGFLLYKFLYGFGLWTTYSAKGVSFFVKPTETRFIQKLNLLVSLLISWFIGINLLFEVLTGRSLIFKVLGGL